MNAFNKELVSEIVKVSEDGLTARHTDPDSDKDGTGVVFGNGPIKEHQPRLYYFEVEMVELRGDDDTDGADDVGLVIGFTRTCPKSPYRDVLDVPNACFLAFDATFKQGFDGGFKASGRKKRVDPININPQWLEVGDRVGFLVDDDTFLLFVNKEEAAFFRFAETEKAVEGEQLWAFVAFSGSALEVRLSPEAEPPPPPGGFDGMDQDGDGELSKKEIDHAVRKGLITREQVAEVDTSGDGTISRQELANYSGDQAWVVEEQLRTGLVMCGDGEVGDAMTSLPSAPMGRTLSTRAKIVLDKLRGKGNVDEEDLVAKIQLLEAELTFLEGDDSEQAAQLEAQYRGQMWEVKVKYMDLHQDEQTMTAFSNSLVSDLVVVSEDGLTARHVDKISDKDGTGVVFGNGKVWEYRPRLYYFEVEIVDLRGDEFDDCADDVGLVIGFTKTCPWSAYKDILEVPDACFLAFDSTFKKGFDGGFKAPGSKKRVDPIKIEPPCLRTGDKVGFLVDDDTFLLFVNKEEAAYFQFDEMEGMEEAEVLWAFVAFAGSALEVRLLPNAEPPPPPGGFEELDEDGDGELSKEEIAAAVEEGIITKEEVEAADTDGDGIISKKELAATKIQARWRGKKVRAQRDIETARAERKEREAHLFDEAIEREEREVLALDADGDGELSKEEVAAAIETGLLTEEVVEAADADGDGKLSAEELEASRFELARHLAATKIQKIVRGEQARLDLARTYFQRKREAKARQAAMPAAVRKSLAARKTVAARKSKAAGLQNMPESEKAKFEARAKAEAEEKEKAGWEMEDLNADEPESAADILEQLRLEKEMARTSDGPERSSLSTLDAQPGSIAKSYQISRIKLGKGRAAFVTKGTSSSTKDVRAVKVISRANAIKGKIENEILIQYNLDHPNIVKLHEVFKDNEKFYLVMELCAGGALSDAIVDRMASASEEDSTLLPERSVAAVVRQMCSAVSYMHSNDFVHRDLKPENILLPKRDDWSMVQIIDFDLSRRYRPTVDPPMTSKVGTLHHMAPEVFKCCYTEKCDVWSVGTIMFLLFCGSPPFDGDTDEELVENILSVDYEELFESPEWEETTALCKDQLKKMLMEDFLDRPSFAELLESPWFHTEPNNPQSP